VDAKWGSASTEISDLLHQSVATPTTEHTEHTEKKRKTPVMMGQMAMFKHCVLWFLMFLLLFFLCILW